MDSDKMYCFQGKVHIPHISKTIKRLQEDETYCDVSIASDDGHIFRAHQAVLAATSTYFRDSLKDITPNQHPIIVLSGSTYNQVSLLIDYIYEGNIKVQEDGIDEFLKFANNLGLKGLSEIKEKNTVEKIPAKQEKKFIDGSLNNSERNNDSFMSDHNSDDDNYNREAEFDFGVNSPLRENMVIKCEPLSPEHHPPRKKRKIDERKNIIPVAPESLSNYMDCNDQDTGPISRDVQLQVIREEITCFKRDYEKIEDYKNQQFERLENTVNLIERKLSYSVNLLDTFNRKMIDPLRPEDSIASKIGKRADIRPAATLEELETLCSAPEIMELLLLTVDKTLGSTVKRMLRMLMTQDLCLKFSFTGLGSKRCKSKIEFRLHKGYFLMLEALSKTSYGCFPSSEINKSIMTALRGCSDWDGRAKKNKDKKDIIPIVEQDDSASIHDIESTNNENDDDNAII